MGRPTLKNTHGKLTGRGAQDDNGCVLSVQASKSCILRFIYHIHTDRTIYPVVPRLLEIRTMCNILTKFNVHFENSLWSCGLYYSHDNLVNNRNILSCQLGTCPKYQFLFCLFGMCVTCYTEQRHCLTRAGLSHATLNPTQWNVRNGVPGFYASVWQTSAPLYLLCAQKYAQKKLS